MPETLRCELLSWGTTTSLCRQLAARIHDSGYRPDVVIAIGRGGYVPARLLCDALDVMALTSIKVEHYLSGSSKQPEAVIRYPLCADIRDQRVLIVDDVNDSGDTLKLALEHVQSFQPREARIAVIHDKLVSHFRVDYFARRIVKWRWLIYPWAVHEDIGAFVERLEPAPRSLDEIRTVLQQRYGIRISSRLLREIDAVRDLLHRHRQPP